jgi:site-specific DNA-methyltransferase (adenine-specific)
MSNIKPGAVILGDCLTVLREMQDGSVDMMITDPPYGMDYQSTRAVKESRREKIANDKAPFIWWIYDAYRVLKEGGGSIGILPLGCAAGVYGRAGAGWFHSQVCAGLG